MYQRIYVLSLFLLAAGCSQRAPWQVVSGPTPTASRRPVRAPATRGDDPTIALSAVAVLPSEPSAMMPGSLLFPVAGVDGARVENTFDAPRDGGRKHNAIDIMAPRGTPVLSVQDGRILRLSKNANGGITLYTTDLNGQFVFYYAHLDRYHGNLYAGRPLLRGDTLGYVGTSGNAPQDTPHLHFQLMRMPADRKYWNGEPINPYSLLVHQSTPGEK